MHSFCRAVADMEIGSSSMLPRAAFKPTKFTCAPLQQRDGYSFESKYFEASRQR
jgi:hypothetical protein